MSGTQTTEEARGLASGRFGQIIEVLYLARILEESNTSVYVTKKQTQDPKRNKLFSRAYLVYCWIVED